MIMVFILKLSNAWDDELRRDIWECNRYSSKYTSAVKVNRRGYP
jgi:hypothetical protein